ncbi:MAG: hypothetical protein HY574_08590 [candidate division NC10 bacterium]|nr:hypothetical protein [candidate division NC10 bacterium]
MGKPATVDRSGREEGYTSLSEPPHLLRPNVDHPAERTVRHAAVAPDSELMGPPVTQILSPQVDWTPPSSDMRPTNADYN